MPFICDNRLVVSGDTRKLNKFIRKNFNSDKTNLVLSKFTPMPKYNDYGIPFDLLATWSWMERNWGSHSDSLEVSHLSLEKVSKKESKLTIDFATETSAPNSWLCNVSAKYPALNFSMWFDEPQLEGAGGYHYSNGEFVQEASWQYKKSYRYTECAVNSCESLVFGLKAHERQSDLGNLPNIKCCAEHKLFEEILSIS